MLIPNHPSDERLSALASRETDATADASLTAHVSTCDRCTDLVNELGALRASLADLPDLQPSRPLRLLPPVADAPARVDRLGGWARRFFAPVLTAGAALAMVGLVGTAAPSFPGFAGQQAGASAAEDGAVLDFVLPSDAESAAQGGGEAAGAPAAAESEQVMADGADEDVDPLLEESHEVGRTAGDAGSAPADGFDDDAATTLPAERSPWPMVLFTGVALMVAAALLRWILTPRTG